MEPTNKIDFIKQKIMEMITQGLSQEADQLLNQLEASKLSDPDLFSLRAMWYEAEGARHLSIEKLSEGLTIFSLDVDLHINLAFFHEKEKQYLEAYHMLMRADYLNEDEEKRSIINDTLMRIRLFFRGGSRLLKEDETKIETKLIYGDREVKITAPLKSELRRKEYLHTIEAHIISEGNVLELEFGSGVISKNLNTSGFDVEGIDSRKKSLVELISKEWQENLRTPDQRRAKYFHNTVETENIKHMKSYDIVVFIPGGSSFYQDMEMRQQMLVEFFDKNVQQLFITINKQLISTSSFYNILEEKNYHIEELLIESHSTSEDGFYLIERKGLEKKRFNITSFKEALKSDSTVLEVDIEKCLDKYGFSYHDSGFHPFTAVTKELAANSDLSYNESVLKRYYELFQPKDLLTMLDLKHNKKYKDGWIGYPWLWNEKKRVKKAPTQGETRPGGNHFFGPNTDNFGNDELNRLKHNLENVKEIGYLPELFADGFISGYLLKNKHDYRFIVTEGQHRMAVLAALGYSKIRVRYNPAEEYPTVVELKHVKKWPQVRNNAYTKKEAELLFEHFFSLDGTERTRPLGFKTNEEYRV